MMTLTLFSVCPGVLYIFLFFIILLVLSFSYSWYYYFLDAFQSVDIMTVKGYPETIIQAIPNPRCVSLWRYIHNSQLWHLHKRDFGKSCEKVLKWVHKPQISALCMLRAISGMDSRPSLCPAVCAIEGQTVKFPSGKHIKNSGLKELRVWRSFLNNNFLPFILEKIKLNRNPVKSY